jgi:hypothetical protein
MYRVSTYVLATVLCVATTAMLATSRSTIHSSIGVDAHLQGDGAFRDGLYLGRLAAESGFRFNPEVGRWSTDQDRATFSTGYQRGYGEALARLRP